MNKLCSEFNKLCSVFIIQRSDIQCRQYIILNKNTNIFIENLLVKLIYPKLLNSGCAFVMRLFTRV